MYITVFPRLYHLIPDGEVTSIKITRTHPSESLSMRLVGGAETPLAHIVIQHIYRDGVIARDSRLLPGDIILKVRPREGHRESPAEPGLGAQGTNGRKGGEKGEWMETGGWA